MSITAKAIIDALGGNHSGMCQCPAHDDTTASLKVSTGNNGKVLVHCHAGCSPDAVIGALKNRGLWGKSKSSSPPPRVADDDDMSPTQRDAIRFRKAFKILRAASRTNKGTIVAEYFKHRGVGMVPGNAMLLNSNDAARLTGTRFHAVVFPIIKDDLLVGAHVTFLAQNGKSNLRDKDGKNVRKIFGPYKGGHVQCRNPNDTGNLQSIIVGEGIENTLVASHVTGISAIAALSATNMPHVSPPSRGETIIAADNDDPGENAAYDLKDTLVEWGRTVRIAMPDGHNDWNEMLNSGAAAADIAASIVESKQFKGTGRVRPLTMEEFLDLGFPPKEYLLKPWLETSSLAMIHAQRGGAKTYFTMSVAYAIATGRPLLGWDAMHPAHVLYVDGELPGITLQKRLRLLGPMSPNLTILSREQFILHDKRIFDLGTDKGRKQLDRYIDETNAEVIILDSLSTLVRSGVENETEAWVPMQDWLMEHRLRGRTIIIVHHEGRSGMPRGASKREDVLDTMIGLKPDAAAEKKGNRSSYELHFTKSREFGGSDKAPLVIHLSTTSGVVEWSAVKMNTLREKVMQMIKQGMTQAQMAKRCGVTPAPISQIVKDIKAEARAEGA